MGRDGARPGNKADARQARQIIVDRLKEQGMTLSRFAETLDARLDKLSPALLCTSPVTPRSIALRIRAAEALGLDPLDLWERVFLTAPRKSPVQGLRLKAVDLETVSPEDWDALPSRTRVKSVMKRRGFRSHKELAAAMGQHARAVTLAIYGMSDRQDLRIKIAEFLEWPIDDLWPEDYRVVTARKGAPMRRRAIGLRASPFFGFGDMRQMRQGRKASSQ